LYKSQEDLLVFTCACCVSREAIPAILALGSHYHTISPLMFFGLSVLASGKGYRVGVEWGKVRDSCRGVLERWFGAETVGKGWYGFGAKWGGYKVVRRFKRFVWRRGKDGPHISFSLFISFKPIFSY
ncbi:hypothetical protein Tco_0193275, partial [Tanacetum coccineum]